MSSDQTYFPEGTKVYSPEEAREKWLQLRLNADNDLSPEDYARLFSNADTGYEILSAAEAAELSVDPDNPWGILYSDRFWTLWRDPVRIGGGDTFMYLRLVGPNLESETAGVVVIPELDGRINLVKISRHAPRSTHWELPRGFADKIIPAVIEELSKECGHTVDPSQVNQLGVIHLDSGLTGQPAAVAHVVVGENQIGQSNPDATESIESDRFFTADQIRSMINSGEITDAPTLSALAILFSLEVKPEGSTFFSTRLPGKSLGQQNLDELKRRGVVALEQARSLRGRILS